MGKLSAREVAALAYTAGLRGTNTIATAVAITGPESGMRTEAHNDDPGTGDDSYGLWQINMIGNLGPSRRRQFGIKSNRELLDPLVNARAMATVSGNGSNFRPWTTYRAGKHNSYMVAATSAAKAIEKAGAQRIFDYVESAKSKATVSAPAPDDGFDLGDVIPGLPDPISEAANLLVQPITLIADVFNAYLSYLRGAAEWIADRSNWIRIAQVWLGGAMVVVGASLIARPTIESRVQTAVKAVK